MSTVTAEVVESNVVGSEGVADSVQAATLALSTEFDDEKKAAKNDETIAEIASKLAVVIDPKSALAQYAGIGKRTFEHAKWQKGNFVGEYEGEDFRRLCGKIEFAVRTKVDIKAVRVATYVRLHCWMVAARALVGDVVDGLSYHLIVNRLLPTLSFSETNLVGEIREGWSEWLKETIVRQTGSSPMSLADLKASMDAREAAIAAEKLAKLSPEKILEKENAAARAERKKKEDKARDQISTGLYAALQDGALTPAETSVIIEKVLADTKVTLPGLGKPTAAFSMMELARTMTGEQADELVRCMVGRNNIEALATLMKCMDRLAPMIRPHLQAPIAAVA